MEKAIKILCVDDEPNVLNAVRRLFLDEDYDLLTALSGQEGLEVLEREEAVQVVISDYRMPGMNGVDFLKKVYHRWPETVRVVLSGYADIASIVSAINEGKIYKFIPKPWHDDELKLAISQAVAIYVLQQEHLKMVNKITRCNEEYDQLMRAKSQELLSQRLAFQSIQDVFDSLPSSVLVVDENKVIVYCNLTCREFFGQVELTMPGRPVCDILPPEVLSGIGANSKEGWVDNLQLLDRRLQVKWKLVAPGEEQHRPRWVIEFWEQMDGR